MMNNFLRGLAREQTSPLLWTATICASLYLALLPFEHTTALENVLLVIAATCAALLWPKNAGNRFEPPPLMPAFLFWLAIALLSLGWSHDAAASIDAIWRDIVKTAIVFVTFYATARQGAPVAVMVGIVAVIATVFAGVAIYDFTHFGGWHNPNSPPRYDVGVAGLMWVPLFLMTISIALLRKRNWPLVAVCACATASLLLAGYIGRSRSFILAVLLGGLLLALFHAFRHRSRRSLLAGWGVVLAMLLLTAWWTPKRPAFDFGDRHALYGKAIEKILANPWLGTGFGHETDKAWYANAFSDSPKWKFLNMVTHPHNIVLSYMDQMGVLGLLVLIVLSISIIRPLLAAARSSSTIRANIGSAGLILVVFALVSNTFNFYFARYHLWMLFALLGLIFGWLGMKESKS